MFNINKMIFLSLLLSLSFQSVYSQRYKTQTDNDKKIVLKAGNRIFNYIPKRPGRYTSQNWRTVIDSTWGSGLPLADKFEVFDAYAEALTNKFDGFISLGLDRAEWDSLKNRFRSKIDSTTSRGIFASIMAQFAMSLRDAHTWAWDTVVTSTPLLPGVPILVLLPFAQADHFGAVLTALPDSTALVLRAIPNHPLGLQPGDIILGYEGVPWKNLVRELLDSFLPVFSNGFGTAPSEIHSFIRNVGNNWHLFDVIDILKYLSQDTLHLSVDPLINLPNDPMMGNEQLEIPGIPFSFYRGWPGEPTGQLLTFGRIPSVNVGYIRLLGEWPADVADPLFNTAVDSLWNEKGLIIDLRFNSGGWSLFDQAFAKMYSQHINTINDVYRVNSETFSLTPASHSDYFDIPGVKGSIFDRPIAVILGPTCVSMGDITAHRLRYHPMTRFFGKPPISSLGDNVELNGYQDWWMNYSISDMYCISQPGIYLNRSEFPIDEPVWFNPDDVSKGIDPIIEKAVNWIFTLSYAHDLVISEDTIRNIDNTIYLTAEVENPLSHYLIVSAIITNAQGSTVDSVTLVKVPGDSLRSAFIIVPGDNGQYYVNLRTDDITSGSYRMLLNAAAFRVILTGVEELAGNLPRRFCLYQNYPNPFNPSTTIGFEISKQSHVTLKIYDLLGREAAELVNETLNAGVYNTIWNAENYASGVYFYNLKAGNFKEVRKLILLK